jgi:hypothetical protein
VERKTVVSGSEKFRFAGSNAGVCEFLYRRIASPQRVAATITTRDPER